MTRILAIGDVMGKPGRRCLEGLLARARSEHEPDIVLVNGENAAGGFGLTKKIFDQFTGPLGIDCVTMGNHWADKREIYDFADAERLVLPANMANVEREESGLRILRAKSGVEFAVINVLGRAFMHGDNRCLFKAADRLVAQIPERVKVRIIDVHAEATSEKQAMGWHFAGRVSLVYGTHSHVPSADDRILGDTTGFCTDLGMTGPYDSVIGIKKEQSIQRLMTGERRKWEPASGDPWLYAIVADVDDLTGRCTAIRRVKWPLEGVHENDQNDE